jgi:cutinase
MSQHQSCHERILPRRTARPQCREAATRSTMAKVSSVVIFGDPDFGQAVTGAASSRTKVICHPDDNICQHGDLILLAHLTYSMNATEAATFVATAAGMSLGN